MDITGFDFSQFITPDLTFSLLKAAIITIIGYALARLASLSIQRIFRDSTNRHQAMLFQRGTYYLILGLFVFAALVELGFNPSVLLGAAGVLTIAIGFASQTSMSNLISGLFLIGEQPFALGDLIKVGDTVGEVLSIDLLSIKLRMLDNTYVRIPNETLLKAEVRTFTRFPIRRIDLQLRVAYKEDIAKVERVLRETAEKNTLCLEEPEPLFIFIGFGDSAVNLQFSVWGKREEYLNLLNSIQMDIKLAFEKEEIEIPFPHRTLYASNVTDPLPVQLVSEG